MIKFIENLDRIKPYVPGKPIEELKRELNLKGEIIKLASNENPFGPSPKSLEILKQSIMQVNSYPDDSSFYLKKQISKKYSCSMENVLIGNGSVEVLHFIVSSVMNRNDYLVRSDYAFIMSLISPIVAGANTINVPMKDFSHDIEALVLEANKNESKILYIDNPANPIGTMLNADEIDYVLTNTNEDTLIIVDEAYDEYLDENKRIKTVELMRKYKNLIVLSTFSKIYGLAGLRVGYMIGSKELIENISKVRLPFNVNLLAQKAAGAALDDDEFIAMCRKSNDDGKKFLKNEIELLGFKPIESFTNFITFDIERDAKQIFSELQKKSIIIRPLSNYGLPTFLRVTIGKEQENYIFIKRFKEVLNEI